MSRCSDRHGLARGVFGRASRSGSGRHGGQASSRCLNLTSVAGLFAVANFVGPFRAPSCEHDVRLVVCAHHRRTDPPRLARLEEPLDSRLPDSGVRCRRKAPPVASSRAGTARVAVPAFASTKTALTFLARAASTMPGERHRKCDPERLRSYRLRDPCFREGHARSERRFFWEPTFLARHRFIRPPPDAVISDVGLASD